VQTHRKPHRIVPAAVGPGGGKISGEDEESSWLAASDDCGSRRRSWQPVPGLGSGTGAGAGQRSRARLTLVWVLARCRVAGPPDEDPAEGMPCHGGTACAGICRVAAAAAGRGPADPGGAGGGGPAEPAVGQRPGAGHQPHRPQGHRRAAGRRAGSGRAGTDLVRRGGPRPCPGRRRAGGPARPRVGGVLRRSRWRAWLSSRGDQLHRPGRASARGRGPAGGLPASDGDRTGRVGQDPAGRRGNAAGGGPVRGRGVAGRTGTGARPGAGAGSGGRGAGRAGTAGGAGG
jgi:hypothetical protein